MTSSLAYCLPGLGQSAITDGHLGRRCGHGPLGIAEVDNGEIFYRECRRSRIHAAHGEPIHRRRRMEDPSTDDGASRDLDEARLVAARQIDCISAG